MRLHRNVRRFSTPLSILSCTDKLLHNDPSFVELSLERVGENFDLDEFIYAVRANQTVKHVCFSGTFVRELSEEQWRTMLEAIGSLVTLEELQIWCSKIPAGTFGRTLQLAERLRKIYFFRVELTGEQEDFNSLGQGLRTHPTLADFRIGGLQLPESISLSPVVEALGETPNLQVVSLQLSSGLDAVAPFSGQALSQMLRNQSIRDLYLSRLGLHKEHFVVIALAMVTNKSLKTLDLFGNNNLSNEQIVVIAKAMEENKTLETLVLPCPEEDLSLDSSRALSHMLQVNTSLITLNLPRSSLCDDGLLLLAEGMSVNTTLKKVDVGVSKNVGEKGTAALVGMLEKNYELERLVVSSAEKSIKDKVEYYMRLNEVGRGSLLRDGHASRNEWVEMLISVSNDLDCLFYFISVNPTLCQFANTRGADVIITHEYKPPRRHTMDTTSNYLRMSRSNKSTEPPRRASVAA